MKEEEEERREEDEQEEEVAFVPTSRAQLDAVCHFFTFLPSPFPRSSLLSPFLSLSLCFTFFPCARQSPRRPLVPPFRYFLVSTCLFPSLSFSLYLFPFARVYPLPRLMPFVSGKRD